MLFSSWATSAAFHTMCEQLQTCLCFCTPKQWILYRTYWSKEPSYWALMWSSWTREGWFLSRVRGRLREPSSPLLWPAHGFSTWSQFWEPVGQLLKRVRGACLLALRAASGSHFYGSWSRFWGPGSWLREPVPLTIWGTTWCCYGITEFTFTESILQESPESWQIGRNLGWVLAFPWVQHRSRLREAVRPRLYSHLPL